MKHQYLVVYSLNNQNSLNTFQTGIDITPLEDSGSTIGLILLKVADSYYENFSNKVSWRDICIQVLTRIN